MENQESVLENEGTIEDEASEVDAIVEDAKNLAKEEPAKDETPEQSARAALEELKKNAIDGDKSAQSEDAPATEGQSDEKQVKVVRTEAQAQQQQPDSADFEPPQRLSAKEKELFNKLPKQLKPAVARMFKEHQAHFTRTQQELSRELQETRAIKEAVQPFAGVFAERGFTLSAGLAALCAAQQKLTDPKTKVAAFKALANDLEINLETLADDDGAPSQGQLANISGHPEFLALQKRLNAIESEKATAKQQQEQEAVAKTVSEFETVVNEKNAVGQYKYPELHDGDFLRRTEPLVSAYLGTIPGITAAQALKKAWADLTGKPYSEGNSNGLNQTRLVAGNNQSQNRVIQPVSVRGRTSQAMPATKSEIAVSANETPEQSARIALEELLRG